jgi:hypothetical protein
MQIVSWNAPDTAVIALLRKERNVLLQIKQRGGLARPAAPGTCAFAGESTLVGNAAKSYSRTREFGNPPKVLALGLVHPTKPVREI